MAPTKEEIATVVKEENEALEAFAAASRKGERAELEIAAARSRLRNARGAKSALFSDLMGYSPKIKSSIQMKA